MQFKTFAFALFATAVAAQSLQQLISEIPPCAKPCLDSASTKVGCSTVDNKCQCSKFDDLTKEAITCVSTSCSVDDLTKTTKISSQICAAVASGAGSSAVSSVVSSANGAATSALNSLASSATAATTSHTPTATPGAGHRAVAGLGFAAAVAALAL
ncbi:hypothetical protein GGR54DRAFT_184933 [Hypoxylon sp. NC1633]|nr:hypothetical protein GGR54DRAFT_184933 [Hypoxylon sp. NC1633]